MKSKKLFRGPFIYVAIAIALLVFGFNSFSTSNFKQVDTSVGLAFIASGDAQKVEIIESEQRVDVTLAVSDRVYGKEIQFFYTAARGTQLTTAIAEANIQDGFNDKVTNTPWYLSLLFSLLPFLLFLGIFWFLMSGAQGGHTFDINKLSQLQMSSTTQNLLFLGFFIAFAIKAPVWPFHTWLPDAAQSATPGTSVLLLGVLDKVGTFGMIRYCLTLFPEASKTFTPVIMVLAVISIIYGAFLAIGAKDIKRLIAYTSISHFGFITMGIFAMTSQGQSGAILYMFNHGFSTAALFLVAGWMISRRGSSTIADFGGLQRVTPVLAWTFFLAGLSSLALPGLSSFVSEFLVLVGTFTRYPVHAIIATFGIVLAALYILIPVQKALHGPTTPGNENLKDLNLREKLAIAPVIAIIVVLGFYPSPLLKVINPAASHVISQMGFTDPAPTNGGK